MTNMRRHFNSKHPFIYAKETNQNFGSDDETDIEKDGNTKATVKKDRFRSWVRKYTSDIDIKKHKCNVCKKVLKRPPGFLGNMSRHFRRKHPSIYAMETNQPVPEDKIKGPQKRSMLWEYFKDLGSSLTKCRLCGSTLSGNMMRHLKSKHPIAFKEVHRRQKTRTQKDIKYKKIKDPFESRHPVQESEQAANYIVRELRDIDSEDERKKEIASDNKVHRYRSWVRNYTTLIGVNEHECHVCKQILKMKPGFIGNMSRHFKRKHPDIYLHESNQQKPDSEDELNTISGIKNPSKTVQNTWEKDTDNKEKTTDDGTKEMLEEFKIDLKESDEEYEVEYLIEDTAADNFTNFSETETNSDT